MHFIFLTNASAQPFAVKGTPDLSSKNGTYKGIVKDRYGSNTQYYRIYFLNDSIFAFTNFTDYDFLTTLKDKKGSFNYSVFEGIGRLIVHNGKKEWWGTRNQMTDHEILNGIILGLKSRPNFLFNIVNTPPPPQGNGSVTVISFKFLENKMVASPARALSGAEQGLVDVCLQKVDNIPLDFTIDKKYYYNSTIANARTVNYIAQVKQDTHLQLITIPEKIHANKKMKRVKKGEEVYLVRVYLDYIFVVKYNAQKEVVKYGWIPRNFLYKLKEIRKNH
ncbi:hypothetical protein GCM10027566_14610 [Arachidicoccus ginsenosidivorans]|uniref:Uncharacterized protein n=1 Tax=Arachidicoccus ginsenosidivorans TaxID=496057 RepID=A0A5B8VLC1_9BACT|nr:hypothetical protein [Arachidicoccus ginsenosidivorans]QEC71058.1 hypothetical protein FSB73_04550 [Arachidicoccus ginsenosidivorans]